MYKAIIFIQILIKENGLEPHTGTPKRCPTIESDRLELNDTVKPEVLE